MAEESFLYDRAKHLLGRHKNDTGLTDGQRRTAADVLRVLDVHAPFRCGHLHRGDGVPTRCEAMHCSACRETNGHWPCSTTTMLVDLVLASTTFARPLPPDPAPETPTFMVMLNGEPVKTVPLGGTVRITIEEEKWQL